MSYWVELDKDDNVVSSGTDADYDVYALEVMNGEGYYDEDGHFHRYHNYED